MGSTMNAAKRLVFSSRSKAPKSPNGTAAVSGRSEESLRQTAPGTLTQLLRQFPGKIRNVRLNHCRTTPLQFALQRTHDIRMIVADIVNTVSGEEIENALSVRGEEFHSHAPLVANIHLQQVEEPHPFPVHSLGIPFRRVCGVLDLEGCVHYASQSEIRVSPQSKSAYPGGSRC